MSALSSYSHWLGHAFGVPLWPCFFRLRAGIDRVLGFAEGEHGAIIEFGAHRESKDPHDGVLDIIGHQMADTVTLEKPHFVLLEDIAKVAIFPVLLWTMGNEVATVKDFFCVVEHRPPLVLIELHLKTSFVYYIIFSKLMQI